MADAADAEAAEKEAEAKLKAKFGNLPNKKSVAQRHLQGSEKGRKYFDSADWAKDNQNAEKSSSAEPAPEPSDTPAPPADLTDSTAAPERPPPIR